MADNKNERQPSEIALRAQAVLDAQLIWKNLSSGTKNNKECGS
jgi:hypothetical protein